MNIPKSIGRHGGDPRRRRADAKLLGSRRQRIRGRRYLKRAAARAERRAARNALRGVRPRKGLTRARSEANYGGT